MRQPKPWYRKQTRSWYVQIGKKQIHLGKNRKAAWEKYHQLMGNPNNGLENQKPSVAELIRIYLGWCKNNLAKSTCNKNRFHLTRFAEFVGDSLRVDSLKPFHVQSWIDEQYAETSTSYKHTAMTVVQGALRWSWEHGYIEHNPLDRLRKPKPTTREFFVTAENWQRLIESCRGQDFTDFVVCMLLTGARPQEMRAVEAKHYDHQFQRFVFRIVESKGSIRQRVIYLDGLASGIVERRKQDFPNGPLFRNSRGTAWTKDALTQRFRRLKRILGMPELCAYSLRHSFAHWQLTNKVDSHVVSKLLGHVDGRMLHTRYGHLEQDVGFMMAIVNRIKKPLK